jgi:hypothetical protein
VQSHANSPRETRPSHEASHTHEPFQMNGASNIAPASILLCFAAKRPGTGPISWATFCSETHHLLCRGSTVSNPDALASHNTQRRSIPCKRDEVTGAVLLYIQWHQICVPVTGYAVPVATLSIDPEKCKRSALLWRRPNFCSDQYGSQSCRTKALIDRPLSRC